MASPSRHSQCCWSTLGNSAGLQQPPRSSRCTCQTLVAKPNPQISITPTPAPDNHGTQNSEENLVIDGAEQQEVLQEPRVRPVHGIAVLQRRFVIPCSVTLPRDLEARALVNWNPPKPRRVNNPTTKMKISAQSNHGTARWISINHQRGEEKARGSWSTRTKRTFEGVEPEGFDHRAQLLLLARGERAMVAHRAVLLHGGGATASASAAHREHRRKASPTIGEPKVKKNKNLTRATAPRGLELSRTSRGGGWTLSGDIAFSPSFFFSFFFRMRRRVRGDWESVWRGQRAAPLGLEIGWVSGAHRNTSAARDVRGHDRRGPRPSDWVSVVAAFFGRSWLSRVWLGWAWGWFFWSSHRCWAHQWHNKPIFSLLSLQRGEYNWQVWNPKTITKIDLLSPCVRKYFVSEELRGSWLHIVHEDPWSCLWFLFGFYCKVDCFFSTFQVLFLCKVRVGCTSFIALSVLKHS